jgi:hypothetical protein
MAQSSCDACSGSGELPTDYGVLDCPECGGSGFLPSRDVLVDWRSRDIERAIGAGITPTAGDVRWLLAELRNARAALTNVVALSHDAEDAEGISQRIRVTAQRALGYDGKPDSKADASS